MAERLAATLAAASFRAAACRPFSGAVADKDRPKIFLQGSNVGISEQLSVTFLTDLMAQGPLEFSELNPVLVALH